MARKYQHLLCRVYGAVSDENRSLLVKTLEQAATAGGADVRETIVHPFFPLGLTAICVLGESHASIHTWPEDKFAAIDFFNCAKDADMDAFIKTWVDAGFKPTKIQIIER